MSAAHALGITDRQLRRRLDLAEQRGISTMAPVPPDGQLSDGISTLYDKDGNIKAQWVKNRRNKDLSPDDIASQIEDALKGYTGKSKLNPPPKDTEDDLATVYVCADWHIGLLCWDQETGGGDWDRSIASRVIGTAMSNLISRTHKIQARCYSGFG